MKRYIISLEMTESSTGEWTSYHDAQAEIERLQKCCTQRGARMQIMRDYMRLLEEETRPASWRSIWGMFLHDRPEAAYWFDDDGVPREE